MADQHVYITTESLDGLEKYQHEVKKHKKTWNIHHFDQAVYHNKTIQSPMQMAQYTEGSQGKHSLIALLLALEGRYYVMTSGSNWSRLIDELRKNVVDVDCAGCTEYIDLREGFEAHNWRG